VSDWVVVYRSIIRGGDNAEPSTSASSLSKTGAFIQARALMRAGNEVLEINNGPNGQMIGQEEIRRWVAANPQ
jgi:hypothetical protein